MATYLIIYLIGCILSYYKVVACFAHDVKAKNIIEFLSYEGGSTFWIVICSWGGFAAGISCYYTYRDKSFFKWSVKDHS